jgi:hypothetical protein
MAKPLWRRQESSACRDGACAAADSGNDGAVEVLVNNSHDRPAGRKISANAETVAKIRESVGIMEK